MATISIPFEFTCGPDASWISNQDIASSLVRASKEGLTPAFRQAYMTAMGPIMRQHEARGISMSQPQCAVCNTQSKKQVLMTPMSYLHLDTPKVSVLVTPVCGAKLCDDLGKGMVNELVSSAMAEVKEHGSGSGGLPGSVENGFGFRPPSKNAHCPCGSSRKYKKCCGKQDNLDEVD